MPEDKLRVEWLLKGRGKIKVETLRSAEGAKNKSNKTCLNGVGFEQRIKRVIPSQTSRKLDMFKRAFGNQETR